MNKRSNKYHQRKLKPHGNTPDESLYEDFCHMPCCIVCNNESRKTHTFSNTTAKTTEPQNVFAVVPS
jgi:hypothetical protein